MFLLEKKVLLLRHLASRILDLTSFFFFKGLWASLERLKVENSLERMLCIDIGYGGGYCLAIFVG